MDNKHPKRKKDKYNPYELKATAGNGRELYLLFNSFELDDISYLNKVSRHIEHSELLDGTLQNTLFENGESLEQSVEKEMFIKKINNAIKSLPPIQKRRLILYYCHGLTFEEIARKEGRSKMAVKFSTDIALKKLKQLID